MEPVQAGELIEMASSAKTFANTGGPNDQAYRNMKAETHRYLGQQVLKGVYLFSLPTWDVIELLTSDAVKLFANELPHEKLKIPTQEDQRDSLHPVQPQLRYLVLIPSSPEIDEAQEAMRLLDKPYIDRMVTVAAVLVDDEIYIPAGAQYIGATPDHQAKVLAIQGVYQAVEGLTRELDPRHIIKAPVLPPHILRLIDLFRTQELDRLEKNSLIQGLMALEDLEFVEALSRLLPSAWNLNSWIATHPQIAERMYTYQQEHPKTKGGALRFAPHKTAWLRPSPYEPTILYHSWGGVGSSGQNFPHFDREKLVRIPQL